MRLQIDIVSDFVCPWCFVGKRRLAQAVAQVRTERPDLAVDYRWLPYFLNPGTPPEGEPYREFMEAKFGSAAQVAAMQQRLIEAGEVSGVQFDFGRIAKRPNTLRAHRLVYRAQAAGYSSEAVWALVERLFVGYFQRGENIGDIGVLAEIAVECGRQKDEELAAVIAYLVGDEGLPQILAQNELVIDWGVSGVPFFVFGERMAVSGAQPFEVMASGIRDALDKEV